MRPDVKKCDSRLRHDKILYYLTTKMKKVSLVLARIITSSFEKYGLSQKFKIFLIFLFMYLQCMHFQFNYLRGLFILVTINCKLHVFRSVSLDSVTISPGFNLLIDSSTFKYLKKTDSTLYLESESTICLLTI